MPSDSAPRAHGEWIQSGSPPGKVRARRISVLAPLSGELEDEFGEAPRIVPGDVVFFEQLGGDGLDAQGANLLEVGLDDFGAGAASFQYLHALEVDFVKFDASLIKNLGKSEREDALIGGLVKLCGELGIDTIGDGIETAEIKDRARAVGIRLGQGYHLGKPATGMAEPQRPQRPGKRKGEQVSWA